MKAANTVGWVSIGLIALGLKDKKLVQIKPDTQRVFIFVSGLALFNMATILLRSYVLSSRYIIALAFILLIFSSFALAALFNSVKAGPAKTAARNPKKWLLVIVIIILCLTFLKSIAPKRQGYNYEREAVIWVEQNTPKNSSVFYASRKLRYYAGVPFYASPPYNIDKGRFYWEFILKAVADGTIQELDNWEFILIAIADGSTQNYDYLVINMDNRYPGREMISVQVQINYKLIKEFVGLKSKKKIMVFAKKPKE
jgi:hypothetical protein